MVVFNKCEDLFTLQMPGIMSTTKVPVKINQIKAQLNKEYNFLKNIFSTLTLPQQKEQEENADYEMVADNPNNEKEVKELPKRARSIVELEEKLEKIKSMNKYNLKNKLAKKSLSSKLSKKMRKHERLNNNKKGKPVPDDKPIKIEKLPIKKEELKTDLPKPVFNNEGKLVFSKFDFSSIGKPEKANKSSKDPKKLLDNIKKQEEKFKEMESTNNEKVKEMKEKLAWKTTLQKAEGQKVKDDPILLKKSIKKMEQKKKQSTKKWENRVQGIAQKKEDRQKKRQENISKKKKEKKSKIVKAAVKRGRVVI